MRKVTDPQSYSNVFYPENTQGEHISVSEIGVANPPAGYTVKIDRSNSTMIQYIVSGSCSFKGDTVDSPAIIATRPGESLEYAVCEGCDDFQAYWIKCRGDISGELLSVSGLYSEVRVFSFDYTEKAQRLLNRLTDEESYVGEDDSLFMTGAFFRLLSLHSGSKPKDVTVPISPYTAAILDHIHSCYAKRITESDMAALVNLSTNYMHKIFLSDMKMTPIYYLNLYRIKQAKRLLRETNLSITSIADAVGISGGDYFCRVFRKYNEGLSPTEYRKRARAQLYSG